MLFDTEAIPGQLSVQN